MFQASARPEPSVTRGERAGGYLTKKKLSMSLPSGVSEVGDARRNVRKRSGISFASGRPDPRFIAKSRS
jgi:hypothetical protein